VIRIQVKIRLIFIRRKGNVEGVEKKKFHYPIPNILSPPEGQNKTRRSYLQMIFIY